MKINRQLPDLTTQTIDLVSFRSRVAMPSVYERLAYGNTLDNLINQETRQLKNSVASHLEKYIRVEMVANGTALEASIHMPYVKDEHVKNLERDFEVSKATSQRYAKEVIELRAELEYEQLPFYKKWF